MHLSTFRWNVDSVEKNVYRYEIWTGTEERVILLLLVNNVQDLFIIRKVL